MTAVRWRLWQALFAVLIVGLAWTAGFYILGVVFLDSTWLRWAAPFMFISAFAMACVALLTLACIVHAAVARRLRAEWGAAAGGEAVSLFAYWRNYFATLAGSYKALAHDPFLMRKVVRALVFGLLLGYAVSWVLLRR